MKFQKKIIFNFIGFSGIIMMILVGIYCYFSYSDLKKTEFDNMKTVATTKVSQFSDMLVQMDNVSIQLLSAQDFLEATILLSRNKGKSYEDIYFDDAAVIVRSALNNYYFMTTFGRVIFFNRNGFVIASNDLENYKVNTGTSYNEIDWISKVENSKGNGIVIGIHEDILNNDFSVLSLVKEIQGDNRGYIEVQQRKNKIDNFIKDDVMHMKYFVFDANTHEIIYSSEDTIEYEEYIPYIKNENNTFEEIVTSKYGNEILFEQLIFEDKLVFLSVNETNFFEEVTYKIVPLVLIIIVLFAGFSGAYVYFSSQRLSEPIKKLQEIMEKSSNENFVIDKNSIISNDEIEILYEHFIDSLYKKQLAENQREKLSMLQLQAQFDMLQAQVNPHFIYNVLNVVSYRGVINDDDVICDICSDLAGMLRYSTNTKEKLASVEEEIENLEKYLRLLKYRYEHKLVYHIDIDQDVKHKVLPKIVLQQIVENSIVHCCEKSNSSIEIDVSGKRTEYGVVIMISDTGVGIEKNMIEHIYQSFEEVKNKLSNNRANVEMEIGGIGLANTFARLYLVYGDNVGIKFVSDIGKGTRVILSMNDLGIDVEESNV